MSEVSRDPDKIIALCSREKGIPFTAEEVELIENIPDFGAKLQLHTGDFNGRREEMRVEDRIGIGPVHLVLEIIRVKRAHVFRINGGRRAAIPGRDSEIRQNVGESRDRIAIDRYERPLLDISEFVDDTIANEPVERIGEIADECQGGCGRNTSVNFDTDVASAPGVAGDGLSENVHLPAFDKLVGEFHPKYVSGEVR